MAGDDSTLQQPSNLESSKQWVKITETINAGQPVNNVTFLDACGSHLFITDEKQVIQYDTSSRALRTIRGTAEAEGQLVYAPAKRSLIFYDNKNQTTCIRRDFDGVMNLNTIFAPIDDGSNVWLELPVNEATTWEKLSSDKLLTSLLEDQSHTEFLNFVQLLGQALEPYTDRATVEYSETVLLCIRNARRFLNEIDLLTQKAIKDAMTYPLIPLIAWLLERLRWAVDARRPYHTLAKTGQASQSNFVDVSTMNSEAARVLSFSRWPHMNYPKAVPREMSRAGFFFQPKETSEDRVCCFACNVSLVQWIRDDEPFSEHERHAGKPCPHLQGNFSLNVPFDLTCSIAPSCAMPLTSPEPKIVSRINAHSDFFVIADSFVKDDGTMELCVFHLESAPQTPISVTVNLYDVFKTQESALIDPKYELDRGFAVVTAIACASSPDMPTPYDADSSCTLFVAANIISSAFKNPLPGIASQPVLFVFSLSRVLRHTPIPSNFNGTRAAAVCRNPPEPPPPEMPSSSGGFLGAGGGLLHAIPEIEDDPFEIDCWSDEYNDDSFSLALGLAPSSTPKQSGSAQASLIAVPTTGSGVLPSSSSSNAASNKKERAKHEEPAPNVEIFYVPFNCNVVPLDVVVGLGQADRPLLFTEIHPSSLSNGLVTVVANSPETDAPALVFYFALRDARLGAQAAKISILKQHDAPIGGKITKVSTITVDQFTGYKPNCGFDSDLVIESLLLLFESGKLIILDPATGKYMDVASDAKDFAIDDKQNVAIADGTNSVKVACISTPINNQLLSLLSDFSELLKTANKALPGFSESLAIRLRTYVSSSPAAFQRFAPIVPLLPVLDEFYSVATVNLLHNLIQGRPIRFVSPSTSRSKSSSKAQTAVESFLQNTYGFQMKAPSNWKPVVSKQKISTLASAADHHLSQEVTSMLTDGDLIPTTLAWTPPPATAKTKPFYAFAMAIQAGSPLAHINFRFRFMASANGSPEILLRFFRPKHEVSRIRSFANHTLYDIKPELVTDECVEIIRPISITEFADVNSTTVTIQVTSTVLYKALIESGLSLDSASNEPLAIYVVIQSAGSLSLIQQINARTQLMLKNRTRFDKTKTTKSYIGKKRLTRKQHAAYQAASAGAGPSVKSKKGLSSRFAATSGKRKDKNQSPKDPAEDPSDSQGSNDNGGIGAIRDFAVTLFRTPDSGLEVTNAALSRFILLEDSAPQKALYAIALGVTPMDADLAMQQTTRIKALNVLTWIAQNWRLTGSSDARAALLFVTMHFAEFFTVGFATATREVAHAWAILVGQLFRVVSQDRAGVNDEVLFNKFFTAFAHVLKNDITKVQSAGALHWFLFMVFNVVYESTFMMNENLSTGPTNELVTTILELIQDLGSTFQQKWLASTNSTISSKYGIHCCITDLSLYDWPHQLVGCRAPQDASNDVPDAALRQRMTFPFGSAATWQTSSAFYVPSMRRRTVEATATASSTDDEILVSSKLFSYGEDERVDFMELLNLNIGSGSSYPSKLMWVDKSVKEGEWFDMQKAEGGNQRNISVPWTDNTTKYTWCRFPIGPELMPGLLEAQPLSFNCCTESEAIHLHADYGAAPCSRQLPRPYSTRAPVVQRVLQMVGETVPTMAALLTAGSMPSDSSILPQAESSVLGGSSGDYCGLFSPLNSYILSTDRASARTRRSVIIDFGGPTLLTDFVIPSSEYLYAVQVTGWWSGEDVDTIQIAQSTAIGSKSLVISNLTPGVLVQKLRLTFVLRYSASKTRIPVGRFFGHQFLTAADIASAVIPYSSVTGEPIPVTDAVLSPIVTQQVIAALHSFCEGIRCRYNIALADMQKVIRDDFGVSKSSLPYIECYTLRLQWNTAYAILERLRRSLTLPTAQTAYQGLESRKPSELGLETLKTFSTTLLSFANEIMNVIDLRDSTLEVLQQAVSICKSKEEKAQTPSRPPFSATTLMNLDQAKKLFDDYCTRSLPILQVMTASTIFKAGCYTPWWPDFFPLILKAHFNSTEGVVDRDIFLTVAMLCAHSVKHAHLQQTVMEKLFTFIIEAIDDYLGESQEKRSGKSALLSWALHLLSAAFDVVSSNKRRADRWAFMSGLFGQSTGSSSATNSNSNTAVHGGQVSLSGAMAGPYATSGKMAAKWRHCFSGEDYTDEIEKPQYTARRLDVIGDRLRYLFSLLVEEVTDVPAIVPPKRKLPPVGKQQQQQQQSSSTGTPGSSTPTQQQPGASSSSAPGTSKESGAQPQPATAGSQTPPAQEPGGGRFLYVPLHGCSTRTRVRQYSARLKISEALCLKMISALVKLLLSDREEFFLPYPAQLLAIKIISKICVFGASSAISMKAALGGDLETLVFKLLSDSNHDDVMIKQAVVNLLLDLTDSEVRAICKPIQCRTQTAATASRTAYEDLEELEVEPKRHKMMDLFDVEMSETNSVSNDVPDQEMDDAVATPSDSMDATAAYYSSHNSCTATASGITDESWKKFDKFADFVTFSSFDNPDSAKLDEFIIRAATIVIVALPSFEPPIFSAPVHSRFSILLHWMYRMARFYIDRGEPTYYIFRYFDEVISQEPRFFPSAGNFASGDYISSFANKMFTTMRHSTLRESSEQSTSAKYFLKFMKEYFTDEVLAQVNGQAPQTTATAPQLLADFTQDALSYRFFQAVVEAKYQLRVAGTHALCLHLGITGSDLGRAMHHISRLRSKLPEITAMSTDATGTHFISAAVSELNTLDQAISSTFNDVKLNVAEFLKADKKRVVQVVGTLSKLAFIYATWPRANEKPIVAPLSEESLVEQAAAVVASNAQTTGGGASSSNAPAGGGSTTDTPSFAVESPLDTAELMVALNTVQEDTTKVLIQQKNVYMLAVHHQFCSELTVAADYLLVQPNDPSPEVFNNSGVPCSASIVDTRLREWLRATLARNTVYHFIPHCSTPRKPNEEMSKETDASTGSAVRIIVTVVNSWFERVQPASTSRQLLGDVLWLYLEYMGHVNSSVLHSIQSNKVASEKMPLAVNPPVLSGEAVVALMNYVTSTPEIDESLWLAILTVITKNVTREANSMNTILANADLEKFFERFFDDALNAYGLGSVFGPMVCEAFGLLVRQLLNKKTSTKSVIDIVISVINKVVGEPSARTLGALPVEPLIVLIEVVGKNLANGKASCDIAQVSQLLRRVIGFIRFAYPRMNDQLRLLATTSVSYYGTGSKPVTLSPSQTSSTNVCFASLSNEFGASNAHHALLYSGHPGAGGPGGYYKNVGTSTAPESEDSSRSAEDDEVLKLPSITFTSENESNPLRRKIGKFKIPPIMPSSDSDFDFIDAAPSYAYERFNNDASNSSLDKASAGKDRFEYLFVQLIKLVTVCTDFESVALSLMQQYPDTIATLVELLKECESDFDDVFAVDLEVWRPMTLADFLLYEFLIIFKSIESEEALLRRFVQLVLQRVFDTSTTRPNAISTPSLPIVYILISITRTVEQRQLFVALDGHAHVAEQLRRCLFVLTERAAPHTSTLFAQLTNLANEVNAVAPHTCDVRSLSSKTVNNTKLYNFAPITRPSLSNNLPSFVLSSVLADLPSRRSRPQSFAYTYQPAEAWMAVTLTLPCQVVLHELVVKFNQQNAIQSPSAIQLEFSSESNPRNWTPFSRQTETNGLFSSTIDTRNYQLPVAAIRIHLRRPFASMLLSISQIAIYGVPTRSTSQTHGTEQAVEEIVYRWLTVFSRLQPVVPSLWQYAPKLPRILLRYFIRLSTGHMLYKVLKHVIFILDCQAQSSDPSVIELVMEHVLARGRLSDGVSPAVAAELLYSFCTESDAMPASRLPPRQFQLLNAIESLIATVEDAVEQDEDTLSIVLWAASCILWTNAANSISSLSTSTWVLCQNSGDSLFSKLWTIVMSPLLANRPTLRDATSWLLCSLCRINDTLASKATERIDQARAQTPDRTVPLTLFPIMAKVWQSDVALARLINNGVFSSLVHSATILSAKCHSTATTQSDMEYLVAVVDLLAHFAKIDIVATTLEGSVLFEDLLAALVHSGPLRTDKRMSSYFAALDLVTVTLCQRCIAYSLKHRTTIAGILTRMLINQPTTRLDAPLLQLVRRLIFEDETTTIVVTGLQGGSQVNETLKDRMRHPYFGCSTSIHFLKASVFSPLKDIIPQRSVETSNSKSSPMVMDDFNIFDYMSAVNASSKGPNFDIPEESTSPQNDVDAVTLAGNSRHVAEIICPQLSTHPLPLSQEIRAVAYTQQREARASIVIDSTGTVTRELPQSMQDKGIRLIPSGGLSATFFTISVRPSANRQTTFELPAQLPPTELTMLQCFAVGGGFRPLADHFPLMDHYEHLTSVLSSLLRRKEEPPLQQQQSHAHSLAQHLQTPQPSAFAHIPSLHSYLGSQVGVGGGNKPFGLLPLQKIQSDIKFVTQQLQQQLAGYFDESGNSQAKVQALIAGTPIALSMIEPPSMAPPPSFAMMTLKKNPKVISVPPPPPPTSSTAFMTPAAFYAPGNGQGPFISFATYAPSSSSGDPGPSGNYPLAQKLSSALLSLDQSVLSGLGVDSGNQDAMGGGNSGGGGGGGFLIPSGLWPQPIGAATGRGAKVSTTTPTDVPLYAIFAMATFLKLDHYAATLVTCDRAKAKKILRAAMGLPTVERGLQDMVYYFTLDVPKSAIGKKVSDTRYLIRSRFREMANEKNRDQENNDNQMVYPFTVLEKLWTLTAPAQINSAVVNKMREDGDLLGALDIILLCASRFSNTSTTTDVVEHPEALKVEQVFQVLDRIESAKEAANSAPAQTAGSAAAGNAGGNAIAGSGDAGSKLANATTSTSTGGASQNQTITANDYIMSLGGEMSSSPPSASQQPDFWAKGTGFGHGNMQAQWNVNEHVRQRRQNEEAVTCLINSISGYLLPYAIDGTSWAVDDVGLNVALVPADKPFAFHRLGSLEAQNLPVLPNAVFGKIYNSCIMPMVHAYMANDSVFDVSKHVDVYEACIWFTTVIAALPPHVAPDGTDVLVAMLQSEHNGTTVVAQMTRMLDMTRAYLSRVERERLLIEKDKESNKQTDQNDTQEEENLEVLAGMLAQAIEVIERRLAPFNPTTGDEESMDVESEKVDEFLTLDELYISKLKDFQYASIPFLSESGALSVSHYYSSQFMNSTGVGNPRRVRRLAQETVTLTTSLPLSLSSSVFVRGSEERLDVFKVLITGPSDTPYANGCFEFDAFFPSDYPTVPPMITLQTTGHNSVRFNPNLYSDGKVCLSVLNTWHGRPEERWNAETSSFLQVLISIQSLILVNEPYFNEPGYERSRNTPTGQQASRDYDANIRVQTVRWAILEQLRLPSRGFEDAVHRHFWIKRNEILETVQSWIDEMQTFADSSPDAAERSIKSSLSALKRHQEALREEFAKMTPPPGLEHVTAPFCASNKSSNSSNDVAMEAETTES